MLYLYTLMMFAWDMDEDTHAYFRKYLEVFINKRKISKDLREFVQDTQSHANILHMRPWPAVADDFIALRLGLSYRVLWRGVVEGDWVDGWHELVHVKRRGQIRSMASVRRVSPIFINKLHPPKYHHDARKLSTPHLKHTNP